jgi:hypothetical protein
MNLSKLVNLTTQFSSTSVAADTNGDVEQADSGGGHKYLANLNLDGSEDDVQHNKDHSGDIEMAVAASSGDQVVDGGAYSPVRSVGVGDDDVCQLKEDADKITVVTKAKEVRDVIHAVVQVANDDGRHFQRRQTLLDQAKAILDPLNEGDINIGQGEHMAFSSG